MSQQKFAPITSSLLARKGSAAPSVIPPQTVSRPLERRAIEPAKVVEPGLADVESDNLNALWLQHATALHHTHEHHDDPGKPKKLFVAMSHGEFERLSIACVKIGLSKHEIVRDALDYYFDQIARDLGRPCACMAAQDACSGNCS